MLGVHEYEWIILHLHFKLLTLKWTQVQKFDVSKMTSQLSLLKEFFGDSLVVSRIFFKRALDSPIVNKRSRPKIKWDS